MMKKEHRMSISLSEEMHEMLLEIRSRPEYRRMSIGAVIRMLIEKGLQAMEQDK